jgi:hypothetical protein
MELRAHAEGRWLQITKTLDLRPLAFAVTLMTQLASFFAVVYNELPWRLQASSLDTALNMEAY